MDCLVATPRRTRPQSPDFAFKCARLVSSSPSSSLLLSTTDSPSLIKQLQPVFPPAFHFAISLWHSYITMARPLPRSPDSEASGTRLSLEQPRQSPTPEVTAPDSPLDFITFGEQSEVERSPPEQSKGPVVNTPNAEQRAEVRETRGQEERRTSKPPRRMKVPWSQDEEEKLLREVQNYGKDWAGIRDEDAGGTLMFLVACAYNVTGLSHY